MSNKNRFYDSDTDPPASWNLPDGAAQIIRHIAAVHLFERLVEKQQRLSPKTATKLTAVDDFSSKAATTTKQQTVDYATMVQVVRQCPSLCHERFTFIGKDNQKRDLLPLALVCTLQPPLEAVQAIYEAYPQAISMKEPSRGSIPLHYAAAYEAPTEVLEFVISKFPEGLTVRLTENISPLDLACYHYSHEQHGTGNIRLLLQVHPEAASEYCSELNWYPLHSAVTSGAPLDTAIRPIFNAYPAAASCLGRGLDSPLHAACKKRGYDQVVQFLIQNSAANILTTPDFDGHTPTILAAMHQTPAVIESLLNLTMTQNQNQNQPHRGQYDHRGYSLLHLAALFNDERAVDYLATRFPAMLLSRARTCRSTPLHLACRKTCRLANIRMLVRHCSDVLHMTDGTGKTPLDLALRRSAKCGSGSSDSHNNDTQEEEARVVHFLREYGTDPLDQF